MLYNVPFTIVYFFLLFQSVFNGMHVIFVPYSLMKVDPASWMKMTTKHKGNELCAWKIIAN